ncbi:MAG TPA: outer membrane channel protein TolC, partial [Glaciecola sp.]|nr:outer membrane channel protein TolC [Glaciecola sp.]
MKKTLLSVIISIGFTGSLHAQDLSAIYQQALDKDPVVNRAKALRDVSLEGVTLARAPLLPQVSGSIGYTMSDSNNVDTDTLNYRV